MNSQRGGISLNILLIIFIIAAAVGAYFIMRMQKNDTTTPAHTTVISSRTNAITTKTNTGVFSDGLGRANATTQYPLDEFGAGVESVAVFNRDINSDGINDRITKTRHQNGTDHFYDQYKIEINKDGKFIDITPDDFRTIEGADCALQRIQFVFAPQFRAIKISRPWQDTWDTPTPATRTEYKLSGGVLTPTRSQEMGAICDVADLF